MQGVWKLAAVATLCGLLAGCAGQTWAPVIPPPGLVLTSTSAPLDTDLDKTQLGTKRGTASTVSILGLFAFGDASTRAAAASAGITTINHADYKSFNLLGIYSSYTTVVYGE